MTDSIESLLLLILLLFDVTSNEHHQHNDVVDFANKQMISLTMKYVIWKH